MTEPWASVDAVAAHLGVAKDSVYRWIDGKGLPAHKIGKLWKFKLSDVDEWVRAGGGAQRGGPAALATTGPSRGKR
jgi:excisionase family DNA binding protein